MNWLFSYGTLQLREVQLANFGRELEGEADSLEGYVLSTVVIGDPAVVEVSGLAEHLILVPGDGPPIEGVAYALTDAELLAADEYETSAYRRVEVTLKSGRRAFVYVAAA